MAGAWKPREYSAYALCRFPLLAKRATQDFPDVSLRQFGAELDVLRPLVAGELLSAVLEHILLGELRVFLHHVYLGHFPGMRIRDADHGALKYAWMHGHHLLD